MLGKDFFLQQMDFSSSILWQSPLTKSKSYWPKHLTNFENIQVHETTKSSFYTLKIWGSALRVHIGINYQNFAMVMDQ